MKFFIVALGLIAAGAIEQTVVAQPQRSAWNGVYSKDQAKRGQALYAQECSPCHGPSMEGGDDAPPLAGAAFAANWDGHTLGELFDRIRLSMPGNDPGKLTPQQNADILASDGIPLTKPKRDLVFLSVTSFGWSKFVPPAKATFW